MRLKFLTKAEMEEFISKAVLTDEEEKILRTRQMGWSREKQAQAIGYSLSGVDKIIKKILKKKERIDNESKT